MNTFIALIISIVFTKENVDSTKQHFKEKKEKKIEMKQSIKSSENEINDKEDKRIKEIPLEQYK